MNDAENTSHNGFRCSILVRRTRAHFREHFNTDYFQSLKSLTSFNNLRTIHFALKHNLSLNCACTPNTLRYSHACNVCVCVCVCFYRMFVFSYPSVGQWGGKDFQHNVRTCNWHMKAPSTCTKSVCTHSLVCAAHQSSTHRCERILTRRAQCV